MRKYYQLMSIVILCVFYSIGTIESASALDCRDVLGECYTKCDQEKIKRSQNVNPHLQSFDMESCKLKCNKECKKDYKDPRKCDGYCAP